MIANVILTAVVLALAWQCKLPGERVEQILGEPEEGASGGSLRL